MSCLITSGIAQGCRNNAGGVKKFYIGSVNLTTATTVSSGGTGTITSFTSFSAYTFYPNKNSSDFVENYQVSIENGTVGYEQVVNMSFSKLQAATRNQVLLLAQGDLWIIVEDRNGKFWLLGEEEGMTLSGGNAGSGKVLTDKNGYLLTFTGMEGLPAQEVTAAAVSSVVLG